MSSLKVHTVQSLATSAALYPVMGENVIPFGLAVIFIDIDHVIEYVRDTKSWDLRGIFAYAKIIENNLDKKFLFIAPFHTLEFLLLILLLALWHPVIMYVFAGMVYHLCVDILYLRKFGYRFARAYSLIEYICRSSSGKYIVTVGKLIKQENLVTAGIHNINSWMEKWNS